MPARHPRKRLIRLLQRAHAGERAAALAYRGHWKSAADPAERAQILRIEEEEWHHRDLLRQMLAGLEAAPSGPREALALCVGSVLGPLCHVSGWLLPMYVAALLETQNVREYETAAALARLADRVDLAPCLLDMARVEVEHEAFFHGRVAGHRLGRLLPGVLRAASAPGMGEWVSAPLREHTPPDPPGRERRHPRRADPARV
jgi:hypothetical protein